MTRSFTLVSLTLALALPATAGSALAGGDPFYAEQESLPDGTTKVVRVTIDFAKLLVLKKRARTVVIGNAGIAAANLSDDRTIVLTGKTAGSTNLIVLDEAGREVANIVLEVVAGGAHLVTVHQGIRRETFTCARRCEPVLSVGDDPDHFTSTASQISARQGFADVGSE